MPMCQSSFQTRNMYRSTDFMWIIYFGGFLNVPQTFAHETAYENNHNSRHVHIF